MVTKSSVPQGCDALELGIQIGAEDVLKGEDEGNRECYQFICDTKVSIKICIFYVDKEKLDYY